MTIRSLFATRLYEAPLGDDALIADLDRACRSLSQEDRAGRIENDDAFRESAQQRFKLDTAAGGILRVLLGAEARDEEGGISSPRLLYGRCIRRAAEASHFVYDVYHPYPPAAEATRAHRRWERAWPA